MCFLKWSFSCAINYDSVSVFVYVFSDESVCAVVFLADLDDWSELRVNSEVLMISTVSGVVFLADLVDSLELRVSSEVLMISSVCGAVFLADLEA